MSTNKIHMEALTSSNNIYANSQFHIYQNPFFAYYLHRVSDYKTGWNALCRGMYYILGGLLDGFGSACMSCCREFEGYRSIARFGKKAGEIKRNDVAHLRYLYSISSPQTAGPGCRDERLSGGQEQHSWVIRKMASRLSNAWKCNPTLASVLGSGRTYESSVSLDSGLGVRSSAQRRECRAGCFKADMAPCQIFLL